MAMTGATVAVRARGMVLLLATACVQKSAPFGPIDAEKPMTVDGPESPSVRAGLHGTLLTTNPAPGIWLDRLDLPGGSRESIRRDRADWPAVNHLSGPDEDGNVLVVTNQFDSESFLRIEHLNGDPGGEIERGRNGWGFAFTFGEPSLAPRGMHGLVLRDPRAVYMSVGPRTSFKEGRLEVLDLTTDRNLGIPMQAIDGSASWFPDGRSFCISILLAPENLRAGALRQYNKQLSGDEEREVPLADGRIPAVFRVDLESRKQTFLQIGRRSVVSSDGKAILIEGIGSEWMKRDVASGSFARVSWPGSFHGMDHPVRRLWLYEGGPVAFVDGDVVLYWGLPTTGTEIVATENNSPLVGEKPMLTVKAARLSTGEFVTLMPRLDPRREVSFGMAPVR